MSEWYYVAYNIMSSDNGQPTGFGTIEIELSNPPHDSAEVRSLADRITDVSHRKGILNGRHVVVLAWSRMGAGDRTADVGLPGSVTATDRR